jgi:hypothetical protein
MRGARRQCLRPPPDRRSGQNHPQPRRTGDATDPARFVTVIVPHTTGVTAVHG